MTEVNEALKKKDRVGGGRAGTPPDQGDLGCLQNGNGSRRSARPPIELIEALLKY